MPSFRQIPPVDELLQRPGLSSAIAVHGRDLVTETVRRATDDLRAQMAAGQPELPEAREAVAAWIEDRASRHLAAALRPSLRRVINATGVIVHTNLGRSPLAAEALTHATAVAAGYANLEYDLEAGARGRRDRHAERLLCALTGAEAALVTNNNAAAVLVTLAALASGREVVVSRGELVEIGGGFRVPDVLAQSGARLREVGTTNRTRIADYAAAIGPSTAALLRVHPSNFTMTGFTERPALHELAALGQRFDLPVVEDLGSGWLGGGADSVAGLEHEPTIAGSIAAGIDLVAFSGDKLLGGPQAGIIVGRRAYIDRIARHPLMRAVRADKLTYAVLEATLALWRGSASRGRIPVVRMLTATADELTRRARRLERRLVDVAGLTVATVEGASTVGGGSSPGSELPTTLLAITASGHSATALEARLRSGEPPVIARIADDRVLVDLRTVAEEDETLLGEALAAAADPADGESRISESN